MPAQNWREVYELALLELDTSKLPGRVEAALRAIQQRSLQKKQTLSRKEREEIGVAIGRVFPGEQPARDAHFVEVSVAGEGEECGLLGFPAEPPDTLLPTGDILHQGGAAGDSIRLAACGVLQNGAVRNRLDQAEPE